MPFAAVELPVRVDHHFLGGSSVQSERKRQLIVAGQGDEERREVRADWRLEQKNRFLAGGSEGERDVAFSPAGHFDVRLRCCEGDNVLLRV